VATTPQGDDPDVRRTVMGALASAVARQRIAMSSPAKKPKKLSATYAKTSAASPRTLRP